MTTVLFISNRSPEIVDYFLPGKDRYFLIPDIYRNAKAVSRGDIIFGPVGEFNLPELLARSGLPALDVVIYHADPAWGFIPVGLNQAGTTSAVILGDMHHLKRPIARMLEFVLREQPMVLIPAFTRQHAHWFHAAGFDNFWWEPSLFVTPHQTELKPFSARSKGPSFCGSTGATGPHSRRTRILSWLKERVPSLETFSGNRQEIGRVVNDSTLAIDFCMNGDMNMRCFESVADGGLLVVDRLSKYSGFEDCFTPGVNCLTFETPSDLLDILQSQTLLKQVAPRIIEASWERYWSTYSPEVTWKRMTERLAARHFADIHAWDNRATSSRARADWLSLRISIYEFVQELHIYFDRVYIDISATAQQIMDTDLDDLVRLRTYTDETQAGENEALLFVGKPGEERHEKYTHQMHLV